MKNWNSLLCIVFFLFVVLSVTIMGQEQDEHYPGSKNGDRKPFSGTSTTSTTTEPIKRSDNKPSPPAKFLVTIEFDNGFNCSGVLVDLLSIASSSMCLEKYIFAQRFYQRPCVVYAGAARDEWRYCVNDAVIDMVEFSRLYAGNKNEVDYGIPLIKIDIPFDSLSTKALQIKPLSSVDKRKCVVYGTSESAITTTSATILPTKTCEGEYKYYMDGDLPKRNFCVVEKDNMTDAGRFLVCANKLVGVLADDMMIMEKDGFKVFPYESLASFTVRNEMNVLLFTILSLVIQ